MHAIAIFSDSEPAYGSYFESEAEPRGQKAGSEVGLVGVTPQVDGVRLFAVDVPRQLGGWQTVSRNARHVDVIANVVTRLASTNFGPVVG